MKKRFPLSAAIAICAALVIFGLLYGNVGGYRAWRSEIESELGGTGAFSEILNNRGCDALNLCGVCRREFGGTDAVTALEGIAARLQNASLSPEARLAADDELEAAAAPLLDELEKKGGRAAEEAAYLRADLAADSLSASLYAYEADAAAFNKDLSGGLGSFLPRLFGVKPLPVYSH